MLPDQSLLEDPCSSLNYNIVTLHKDLMRLNLGNLVALFYLTWISYGLSVEYKLRGRKQFHVMHSL